VELLRSGSDQSKEHAIVALRILMNSESNKERRNAYYAAVAAAGAIRLLMELLRYGGFVNGRGNAVRGGTLPARMLHDAKRLQVEKLGYTQDQQKALLD
jgi:hypothetical protein